MAALLAAAPLAVILVGMGVLRRSAAVAGAAGLIVTLLLWLAVFEPAQDITRSEYRVLSGALLEAVHSTATILWIILPALAIFEFQRRAGAIERIRDTLAALTEDRRLQALLIAWFFGLFMEGAAGFGTPVALAAPLLVGLGYSPVRAVILALLGHAAGVSFGAVGTPLLAQVELAGLDAGALATRTAMLHAVAGPILLLIMVRLAGDAALKRSDIGWTALAALCFFVPSVALAALAGPELPTLGGALFGATAFVLLLQRHRSGPRPALRRLLPDLLPYLIILLLVLTTRLMPPVQQVLSGLALTWTFDEIFRGAFQPLYHPGTMLFLGLFAGASILRRGLLVGTAIVAALRRLLPVALALFIMLALSRLMVHSGMIAELASAASAAGLAWPLVSPLIGVLGTFITGSATASNILFTELQLSTAAGAALPPIAIAAAQGFGAAIGNVIAPHNIIAGSATVGLVGREGDILARTMLPCAIYALVGGAVVFALSVLH